MRVLLSTVPERSAALFCHGCASFTVLIVFILKFCFREVDASLLGGTMELACAANGTIMGNLQVIRLRLRPAAVNSVH